MNYSVQRQLSVAIENQPGRLAAITRAMGSRGINIKDLSVIDNVEQGMIRLVTNDPVGCKALLIKEGFVLKDTPGKLSALCQALADAKINIDYAYGSEDSSEEHIRIVMKVSNLEKACQVIQTVQES